MRGWHRTAASPQTAKRRGLRRWGVGLLASGLIVAVTGGVTVETPAGAAYTAAVRLLGTSIGVGPTLDGFGVTIPLFLYGTAVPEGDSFHTVPYPAIFNLDYPIVSDLPILSALPYWPEPLKQSEEVGAGYLEQDLAAESAGEMVTIIGMSQGAQVAEIARADMAKDPTYVADAHNYRFVLLGNTYQPNGGILARFTSWSDLAVLGDIVPFGRPGPSDSPFQTTYYQNEYDGFADFPAYFNGLAIANAVVGIYVDHVLPGYLLESADNPNAVSTTIGNTTYVTIPQYLPLLAPFRAAASLVGAQRIVDAVDPMLRVFVDMGYNRTADPSQVQEFSWTTPPEKVSEAFAQLPGAIAQGLAILGGAPYVPTVPQPVVSATEPPTPVTEHPAQPVDTSPTAQAVRRAVLKVSAALTDATEPLAKLLRTLGGQSSPSATTTVANLRAAVAVPHSARRTVSLDSVRHELGSRSVRDKTHRAAAPTSSIGRPDHSKRPAQALRSAPNNP
jgi:hypothetical protein